MDMDIPSHTGLYKKSETMHNSVSDILPRCGGCSINEGNVMKKCNSSINSNDDYLVSII